MKHLLSFGITVLLAGTISAQIKTRPRVAIDEVYSVDAVIYRPAERNVYLFGYVMDSPHADSMPTINRPRILRIGVDSKKVEELTGVAFGVDSHTRSTHAAFLGSGPVWFVDPAYQRFMRVDGSREENVRNLASRLVGLVKPEVFFDPRLMPMYRYLISVDPTSTRMWVTPTDDNGVQRAAYDFQNEISWSYLQAQIIIRERGKQVSKPVGEYASAIVPNEVDGTAWIYLSHETGALIHLDRRGNVLKTIPIGKRAGDATSVAIDTLRRAVWHVDLGQRQLLKTSLEDGTRQLALDEKKFSALRCLSPFAPDFRLAVATDNGHVWLYCRTGVHQIDPSGALLTSIPLDPLLRTR